MAYPWETHRAGRHHRRAGEFLVAGLVRKRPWHHWLVPALFCIDRVAGAVVA